MHSSPSAHRDPPSQPIPRGPLRLVSSLRHRDWRLLWFALVSNQAGEWMDHLAVNWLVLVLTDSPLAVGMVNLMRGIPTIVLSLAGGVVADRVDRRRLMIWTKVAAMAASTGLAMLATANFLELWLVYALVFLRGVANAFNSPARASVVGDLVPRSDVTNAMALHSANFNITRLFGPALAGFLIATVGTAFVLWVNVASYFVSIGLLLAMHAAPSARSQAGSAWATLVEGLAYIWHTPTVLMLVLMSVLPFLLGQQYQTMLPVFAKDVLSIGPEGLGLLTAATAAGSLVGTFGVAALGDIKSKGLVLMVSVTAYAALIVAFALSPWALLSAGLLFAVGAANQVYQTTNGTLLQLQVPSEYRGRVMGVHQLDRGFIPVGGFMAGALAEAGGAPFATGLLAAILVVFCLAVAAFVPRMRAIR